MLDGGARRAPFKGPLTVPSRSGRRQVLALGPWRPPPGAFAGAADLAVTDVLPGSRAPAPAVSFPLGRAGQWRLAF